MNHPACTCQLPGGIHHHQCVLVRWEVMALLADLPAGPFCELHGLRHGADPCPECPEQEAAA